MSAEGCLACHSTRLYLSLCFSASFGLIVHTHAWGGSAATLRTLNLTYTASATDDASSGNCWVPHAYSDSISLPASSSLPSPATPLLHYFPLPSLSLIILLRLFHHPSPTFRPHSFVTSPLPLLPQTSPPPLPRPRRNPLHVGNDLLLIFSVGHKCDRVIAFLSGGPRRISSILCCKG